MIPPPPSLPLIINEECRSVIKEPNLEIVSVPQQAVHDTIALCVSCGSNRWALTGTLKEEGFIP